MLTGKVVEGGGAEQRGAARERWAGWKAMPRAAPGWDSGLRHLVLG